MKVQITSDNRELILRIMQDRLGQEAEYHTLPMFSYTVGPYTLTREGCIEAASDDSGLVKVFASLGMCDYPFEEPAPAEDSFTRSTKDISSGTMMNLISIVSARQLLLNRALGRRNAFFVSKPLMRDLLNHPPTTIPEFLQALYSRDDEYKGIVFTLSYVSLSGFRKCRPEETELHRQLSELIFKAASSRQWTKAFCPRVRNQKYAFRTWLNSIGMIGPEYEAVRVTLLSRLSGRTDRRRIPSIKEA